MEELKAKIRFRDLPINIQNLPTTQAMQFTGKTTLTPLIDQGVIKRELVEKLATIDGRTHFHLVRLLLRPGAERDFAIGFPENYGEGLTAEEKRYCEEIISSEGADTAMFWTLSPYIYRQLIGKGLSPLISLQKIARWGAKGNSDRAWGRTRRDFNVCSLPGTEYYYHDIFYLEEDPNGLSHEFASQEAEEISNML